MRSSWHHTLLVTAMASLAGCHALAIVDADPDSALETEGQAFSLVPEGDGLRATIPLRFTNHLDRTVYIVNCNGYLSPSLERNVDGAWTTYWTAAVPQCLSEPIVIGPGETMAASIDAWAALPGRNVEPSWPTADPAGEYRLVLHAMVFDYTPDAYPFGPDVPRSARTSNAFLLTGP